MLAERAGERDHELSKKSLGLVKGALISRLRHTGKCNLTFSEWRNPAYQIILSTQNATRKKEEKKAPLATEG